MSQTVSFASALFFSFKAKWKRQKKRLINSRRIYELADDTPEYNYCEAILAGCEIEGLKVRLIDTWRSRILTVLFCVYSRVSKIFLHSLLEPFLDCFSANVKVGVYHKRQSRRLFAALFYSPDFLLQTSCHVSGLFLKPMTNGEKKILPNFLV